MHESDFAKLLLGMRLSVRDKMRRGLTGNSGNLLRSDVQEIRKRQRASNQLPALLEIELVEAAGPSAARRRGGRAQRHVNYEQP